MVYRDSTPRKVTKKQQVLDALASGRPMRFAEVRKIAGSYIPIQELIEEGRVVRVAEGIYGLPEQHQDWNSLATLGLRYPNAVVCLDTAAAYHQLTTQNPHDVFAAFPYGKTVGPRHNESWVRSFRWREKPMEVGVEKIEVSGVEVQITSAARTVVDLLRFRSRRGDDEQAIDALNSFMENNGDMKSLIQFSKLLNCENSVRPFTTALSGLRNQL